MRLCCCCEYMNISFLDAKFNRSNRRLFGTNTCALFETDESSQFDTRDRTIDLYYWDCLRISMICRNFLTILTFQFDSKIHIENDLSKNDCGNLNIKWVDNSLAPFLHYYSCINWYFQQISIFFSFVCISAQSNCVICYARNAMLFNEEQPTLISICADARACVLVCVTSQSSRAYRTAPNQISDTAQWLLLWRRWRRLPPSTTTKASTLNANIYIYSFLYILHTLESTNFSRQQNKACSLWKKLYYFFFQLHFMRGKKKFWVSMHR